MNEPIDLVIPYVNSLDPVWQNLFMRSKPASYNKENRFRDFGTIETLFELIDKFCPWLRNIYLVVQSPSQVPECVTKFPKIHVVYHDQIIPQQYLPTYNSATIELFVWKIEGLAEHFLYINDDMYPIGDLSADDFYDENGNPKITIKETQYVASKYRRMLKNTERLVNPDYIETNIYRDGHSWTPMKVSTWRLLFELYGNSIYNSLSMIRENKNIVQQLCTYWHYFNDQYSQRTIKTKYYSLSMNGLDVLASPRDYDNKIICINDNNCSDYELAKKTVGDILNNILCR